MIFIDKRDIDLDVPSDNTKRKPLDFTNTSYINIVLLLHFALYAGYKTLYIEDTQHNKVIEESLMLVNPFL